MAEEQVQTGAQQKAKVTITRDNMYAMLVIYPPAPGENPPNYEDVHLALKKASVVHGIRDEVISKALNEKVYNTPIQAAYGTPPKKGEDSKHSYTFNLANNHSPHEDSDGRVDYKDLSFIQNATDGMVLATRVPPTEGTPGINVLGKPIQAGAGRDIKFKAGSNTRVSDDGMSLYATANGAIVYRNGEVSVKDVMTISQDVDINTGNIDCRGSVKINGDVKAGFNIVADGDLEVSGHVEDCNIKVSGNIMVKGGFFGNGTGLMQAEGNITLKFAEGQKIIAGGDITVGGEIVHCNLLARGNIYVKGKKGKILGGEVRAGKTIQSAVLGSEASTATNLYVAYDAALMAKYYEINKELTRLKNDSSRIKEALYSLYRLQMDGKLNQDKLVALQRLESFQKDLPKNLETLENQKKEIEEKLKEYKDAKIIAEETIYPGVKAHFGLVYREILEEVKACKLTLEGSQVLLSSYHK